MTGYIPSVFSQSGDIWYLNYLYFLNLSIRGPPFSPKIKKEQKRGRAL